MQSPARNPDIVQMDEKYTSKLFEASNKELSISGKSWSHNMDARARTSHSYSYMTSMLQMERQSKRSRVQYETDIDESRKQQKRYRDENEQLKIQVEGLTVKLNKTQEQLDESRTEMLDLVKKYTDGHKNYTKQIRTLETERDKLLEEKNGLISSTMAEVWQLKKELNSVKLEKEEADKLLQLQTRMTEEAREQKNILESKVHNEVEQQHQMKELRHFRDQYEEDAIVLKNLKEQYKNFPQIHKEYLELKSNQENTHLLKEKLEDVREKYKRAKVRCAQLEKLEPENKELQCQLSKWNAMKSPQSARSVQDLLHDIATLQSSEAVLLQNQSSLKSHIQKLEESLERKEAHSITLQTKLSTCEKERDQLKESLRVRERKLLLIKQQRDSFREIVDTYEKDCTVQLPAALSSRNEQQHRLEVRELEGRCREYETRLQDVNNKYLSTLETISKLKKELADVKTGPRPAWVTSDADQRVIDQLRAQVSRLEEKLEKVTDEKFHLDTILTRHCDMGGLDPRNTRALQLADNPISLGQKERAGELQKLQEENRRLNERVRLLQENDTMVIDITQQIDENIRQSGSIGDIDQLREKLKNEELKNTRLIEVFKKTSHELRNVCYELTGYQIFITETNNYKVYHMHSASREDFLLFRQNSSGIHLLETKYSLTLTDLINDYLVKQNSLPAFMNALALELFNKHSIKM